MSQWQPIETAPKDGTFVQLYDDRYKHSPSSYLMAKYDHGIWWGQMTPSGKAIIWRDATHWMPLPPPPDGT